jgi:hypothetical protein
MENCSVANCTWPVHVKKHQLCKNHYQRRQAGLPLEVNVPGPSGKCLVQTCNKPKHSRDLCTMHASIASRYKLETPDFIRAYTQGYCDCCGVTVSRVNFDHDHGCCPSNNTCGNCLRGILCHSCNITLGRCRDKPEVGSIYDIYLKTAPHFIKQKWIPRYKK